MFLNEFSKNNQRIFLNLAYTIICADDNIAEKEKRAFQAYFNELQVERFAVKRVDFSTEMDKLDPLATEGKKKFFLELLAIACVDGEYAEVERNLIHTAQQKLLIEDGTVAAMEEILKKMNDVYSQLQKLLTD